MEMLCFGWDKVPAETRFNRFSQSENTISSLFTLHSSLFICKARRTFVVFGGIFGFAFGADLNIFFDFARFAKCRLKTSFFKFRLTVRTAAFFYFFHFIYLWIYNSRSLYEARQRRGLSSAFCSAGGRPKLLQPAHLSEAWLRQAFCLLPFRQPLKKRQ